MLAEGNGFKVVDHRQPGAPFRLMDDSDKICGICSDCSVLVGLFNILPWNAEMVLGNKLSITGAKYGPYQRRPDPKIHRHMHRLA